MKKSLILAVIIGVLAFAVWFVFTENLYVVPILAYHHIDEEIHKDSPTVLVENFQKQMEFIHKRGYNVISLDEFIGALTNEIRLPRNSVVITIDDGYRNNYTQAYPVFKNYNLPAAIFVITNKIGEKDSLTWPQIIEMNENDITFGAHTRNHAYLPELKGEQLEFEILGSKRDLERKLNSEVKYFCYPIGGFSEETAHVVEQSGFKAAFTTNRGEGRFNKNLFALKRVKMTNSDTNAFRMWGKLSGFYNLFREEKSPY